MKSKITFIILCLVCAAVPIAAQTTAPENTVQIPAGKFWMGRAYTIYSDSADLVPRDKLDDRPANNIHLDAFYIDKYEVTNADYARFIQATGARRTRSKSLRLGRRQHRQKRKVYTAAPRGRTSQQRRGDTGTS